MNGTACLLNGDVMEMLATLPSESVHCVVTSPPYWGLRDYGVPGQLGLEPTPQEHIARMVEVFREVRRVMRRDATLWLNYGDCYAGSWGNYAPGGIKNVQREQTEEGKRWERKAYDDTTRKPPQANCPGLKPKDLCMMPHRLAIALQDDGWWVRSDIVWNKPNPMPESITDRPVKSHEYIFLLAKAERYYYDAEAVKEPSSTKELSRPAGWADSGDHTAVAWMTEKKKSASFKRENSKRAVAHVGQNNGTHRPDREDVQYNSPTRNRRSVWTIATEPYPDAHFATYPTDLVRPCILAGTSEKGVCSKCGAPWDRVRVPSRRPDTGAQYDPGRPDTARRAPRGGQKEWDRTIPGYTAGWQPSCKCEAEPIPATVLDPFFGSGTTGAVALEYGRNIIGIELNPEYLNLAEKRIAPYLHQGRLTL